MKIQKLFQKTLFGTFFLFGLIAVSTSVLCIYTVDTHLSREYESNSKGIAKTIADASVDIILNRDLSALQSLIDQFVEIQGISYIYITNETGEFLAHTFVPGIPGEIRASDPASTETVERSLPGMGDFIEVSSPILAGVAGAVGILAAIWFVGLAGRSVDSLLAYAVSLARDGGEGAASDERLIARDDEIGELARLFLHFAESRGKAPDALPAGND